MAEVDDKRINPGSFDQVVGLKELVITKGEKAQTLRNYVLRVSPYASVEVMPINESVINDNTILAQRITVVSYFHQGITSRWRLDWNGDSYDIVNIIPVKGSVYMKLEAVKIISNGQEGL